MLSDMLKKEADELIIDITRDYFQLDKYLSDDRMKTNFQWVQILTTLFERILVCLGQDKRIADILVCLHFIFFLLLIKNLYLFRLNYLVQFILMPYMKQYVKLIQTQVHYGLILCYKH